MYIPKELIFLVIGYILCPITAYIYVKIKEHKEKKNDK